MSAAESEARIMLRIHFRNNFLDSVFADRREARRRVPHEKGARHSRDAPLSFHK